MGATSILFGQAGGKDSVPFEANQRKEPDLSETFAGVAANWFFGNLIRSNVIRFIDNQEILEEMAAGKRKGFSGDDFPTVIRRGVAVGKIAEIGNARSQRFLEKLATTDSKPTIREFATGEVKSQSALADLIKSEKHPEVLKAAIRNVKRPDVLEEALVNNYENASVLVAISDRIKELPDFVQSMIGKSSKQMTLT